MPSTAQSVSNLSARRRLSAWYFFYFAFIGAFSPYFTLYLQSLGIAASDIGILMSLMLAMRLVAPNLWGWLSDHWGRKVVVIRASAMLAALGHCLFFFASGYWGLFVAMAFMAFFWSAALPLVEALTLRNLEGQAEQYGRIRLWGSVGFIVIVLGTGAWLDHAPIGSLLWLNLILLLGVFACAMTLVDAPGIPAGDASARLRTELFRPRVLALLAACFFMSAAHSPYYVFFSIHLVDHGYDKLAVGALWSLGVVAEIGVFFAMPRMLRLWSLRSILMCSFALAVLRFMLIGWGVGEAGLLLIGQLLHGATFGAYHAAVVGVLNRWFPAHLQGRVQALYGSLSFGAGGMFGNIASGATWDWAGSGPTFSLGALFAAVSLLLVWLGWHSNPVGDDLPVR